MLNSTKRLLIRQYTRRVMAKASCWTNSHIVSRNLRLLASCKYDTLYTSCSEQVLFALLGVICHQCCHWVSLALDPQTRPQHGLHPGLRVRTVSDHEKSKGYHVRLPLGFPFRLLAQTASTTLGLGCPSSFLTTACCFLMLSHWQAAATALLRVNSGSICSFPTSLHRKYSNPQMLACSRRRASDVLSQISWHIHVLV